MSKKRKRQNRSEAVPASRLAPPEGAPGRLLREEFKPDYSYVVKDLRRIGALAGGFLLILVMLSFFLR